MAKIVECVPNFSEGCDIKTINAIAGAISGVTGVKFISAEPDKDYNRTVVTFVGTPAAVVQALHDAYLTALKDPAVVERLKMMGSNASALSAEDFAKMVVAERDKYQEIVKLSGAQVN